LVMEELEAYEKAGGPPECKRTKLAWLSVLMKGTFHFYLIALRSLERGLTATFSGRFH